MSIVVTGAAGFIGFHTSKRLLDEGCKVVGIDCVNDYYDPKLKYDRLEILKGYEGFSFYKEDISDRDAMGSVFKQHQDIEYIINDNFLFFRFYNERKRCFTIASFKKGFPRTIGV